MLPNWLQQLAAECPPQDRAALDRILDMREQVMKEWYQIHLPYSFDAKLHWSERKEARKKRIDEIPREVFKKKYRTEDEAIAALVKIGERPESWEICECGYL